MNPLENLPPFYVGQKVVAIANYHQLVKDEIYTVRGFISPCKCDVIEIDLPEKCVKMIYRPPGYPMKCKACGTSLKSNGYSHYKPSRFAPLQESAFPTLTLSRVIEKERELVSMN